VGLAGRVRESQRVKADPLHAERVRSDEAQGFVDETQHCLVQFVRDQAVALDEDAARVDVFCFE
jgi:hypothetical protein